MLWSTKDESWEQYNNIVAAENLFSIGMYAPFVTYDPWLKPNRFSDGPTGMKAWAAFFYDATAQIATLRRRSWTWNLQDCWHTRIPSTSTCYSCMERWIHALVLNNARSTWSPHLHICPKSTSDLHFFVPTLQALYISLVEAVVLGDFKHADPWRL